MVGKEDDYRKAKGTKSVRKSVRPRTGAFHRMDKDLAKWVRESRALGLPVETFMLEIEGKSIMKEVYPDQFDEEGACMFKFSTG